MSYEICPDCNAAKIGEQLQHLDSCPLGLGHDQASADDRLWFALRPSATVRRRPAHWAEVAELRAAGWLPDGAELLGEIVVTKVTDGFRLKSFAETYWLLPTEGVAR